MSGIHFNRFVVVFNLTNRTAGYYDAFLNASKRLGEPYSFGPNWLLLKSPRPLDEVTQGLAATIDPLDRVLVLELEHGKRPTRHRIAHQMNFSAQDVKFLETF